MKVHPALFYSPGDRLSLSELAAARLDGHVVEVGEGYMPADTVEGADARATSLRALLTPGAAVCGPSAAWVHGAGDAPPARHHACRADAAASRPRPGARLIAHDSTLNPEQVTMIGDVPVATPVAVAVELALRADRDEESVRWLRALLEVSPAVAAEAHTVLDARRRVPGKRAALAVLRELAGQEVVTR